MSHRVPFTRGILAAGLIATLFAGTPNGTVYGAVAPQVPAASQPLVVSQPLAAPQTSSVSQALAASQAPSALQARVAPQTPAVPQAPAAPPVATAPPTSPGAPAGPPSSTGSTEPSEDIRDIRGPKYVFPPWLLPALLAGAALLALGAYGIWRWQRRRQRPRALLPFEVALQRLEEIRVLMQPASAREFSIAVSDIVRRYIEQRFDVIATHRTTEEFLRDLLESSNPSLARHRGLLSEFLHQCDLVKFAGMSLSAQSMESLHHSARAFVLETAKPDDVTQVPQTSPSPGGQAPTDPSSVVGQSPLGQSPLSQSSLSQSPLSQSQATQSSGGQSLVVKEARDSLPSA
jgi:Domain of unknown function (DUF4381)